MVTYRKPSSGGSTWLGILIGLVLGCALCAAAALIITDAPVPFVEKVQKSTRPIDASALDGKDPNAALYDNTTRSTPVEESLSAIKTVEAPTAHRLAEEPNAAQAAAETYIVQAGAFRSKTDAEKIRTDLAFIALEADVVQSTDAGVTLYRVVLGPFDTAREANELQQRLTSNGFDAMVVRNRK
ncbi:MAG TPA: SPOR domain-containing protein [Candidatus Aphodousia gallistercoris]|nr:SPOR domain-containing protein [Candidatus Aphodousia gallistercoris]